MCRLQSFCRANAVEKEIQSPLDEMSVLCPRHATRLTFFTTRMSADKRSLLIVRTYMALEIKLSANHIMSADPLTISPRIQKIQKNRLTW